MRAWNEFVAALSDVMSVPLMAFLSFLATLIIALLWYFWPAWLPSNWRLREGGAGRRSQADRPTRDRWRFRLGRLRWRLRWRWRRRKRRAADQSIEDLPPDVLPDLPAEVLALTADQLAAAGRYAEAVRERLRSIVRGLIERGVIPHSPGWTVTELAAHATRVRPELTSPLRAAADVFSGIWYGLRPATVDDDTAMRAHAATIADLLTARVPA